MVYSSGIKKSGLVRTECIEKKMKKKSWGENLGFQAGKF